MSNEVATIHEGQLTGTQRSEQKAWPGNLRFVHDGAGQRILQEQWEITETNYDDETSRTWKEWRDVPTVTNDDG